MSTHYGPDDSNESEDRSWDSQTAAEQGNYSSSDPESIIDSAND